jgi:hypothetical protein
MEYVSSKQLRTRYGGRSHMWIERLLKADPDFPKPIYIGRLRFWKLPELETWERTKATGREAA